MRKSEQHDNNTKMIIEQLLAGRRITVQSVRKSVGTQELRHYIPIIRTDFGLIIDTEWKQKNGYRYKEYFLRKEQKVA